MATETNPDKEKIRSIRSYIWRYSAQTGSATVRRRLTREEWEHIVLLSKDNDFCFSVHGLERPVLVIRLTTTKERLLRINHKHIPTELLLHKSRSNINRARRLFLDLTHPPRS